MTETPVMHVFDADEDGPTAVLVLPVEVIWKTMTFLHDHATPNQLPMVGPLLDEVRGQMREQGHHA